MNVSLGPFDGIFTYDDRILATGIVAAAIKALTEFWFVRLLPIPYALLRLLPRLRPAVLGGITELPGKEVVAASGSTPRAAEEPPPPPAAAAIAAAGS